MRVLFYTKTKQSVTVIALSKNLAPHIARLFLETDINNDG